jgi:thioredoxin 1
MAEGVITLTESIFEREVIESDKPVLVDFWAQWCGPCRRVAPIIEELAADYQGKAKVAKVNVDEEGALAEKFRIMSIPTILIFKDGNAVEKLVGVRSKSEFASVLDKYL